MEPSPTAAETILARHGWVLTYRDRADLREGRATEVVERLTTRVRAMALAASIAGAIHLGMGAFASASGHPWLGACLLAIALLSPLLALHERSRVRATRRLCGGG